MFVSVTFFSTDTVYGNTFESYNPASLVKVPVQSSALILRCSFHNSQRIIFVTWVLLSKKEFMTSY